MKRNSPSVIFIARDFAITAALTAVLTVSLAMVPQIASAAYESRVVVSLRTLHEVGGQNIKGPDGMSINVRFSMALRKALGQAAQTHFAVTGVDHEDPATPGETRYILEGDLSHLDTSVQENEPYLCTLRLFSGGKAKRLVGQWAGTAATLRDLTGNLRSDPSFDRNGLAGELAHQVASAMMSRYASGLEEMLRSASQLHRLSLEVVPEAGGEAFVTQGADSLAPGRKFRIKVSSQDVGTVYLLERVNGKVRVLFAPEFPLDVAPGRSALLPMDAAIATEQDWIGATREYIALVRPRPAPTVRSTVGGLRPGSVEDTSKEEYHGSNSASPVQVVGTSTAVIIDPALARLLDLFRSDPPGTWSAAIVRLTVRGA